VRWHSLTCNIGYYPFNHFSNGTGLLKRAEICKISMMKIINIESEDIMIGPQERKIAMEKTMVFFRLRNSSRTNDLDTGKKFKHENTMYQIMNREKMHDEFDYINLNCWILQSFGN
jgi:hypothetical protein